MQLFDNKHKISMSARSIYDIFANVIIKKQHTNICESLIAPENGSFYAYNCFSKH